MYKSVPDAERAEHPRANANIFEILTFSWMLDLFRTGRRRDLDENDLYTTLDDHKSSLLGDELEGKWLSELSAAREAHRSPSLIRVLIRTYGPKVLFYGVGLCFYEMVLKISQPLFIGKILDYFSPSSSKNVDLNYAYNYSFGLVLNMCLATILFHSTVVELIQCEMKMRVAFSSIIFRKALRLSQTALSEMKIGQIINLVSSDATRMNLIFVTSNYVLWLGPLQTIVVTYFLWQEIGVSSLVGVAALLFFIPLQGWLGKKMSKIRIEIASKTDERVRLMNEIIMGIQIIKMYTWEKPFAKLIEYTRKQEIQQIKKASFIRGVMLTFALVQTRFQLFVTILSYILLGNSISIRKVFVITAFYNILVPTMTVFFGRGLALIAVFLVSIKRIQDFLLCEEKDKLMLQNEQQQIPLDNNTNENNEINQKNRDPANEYCVVISNATAKWTNHQTTNSLHNISLTVRRNRLVAIIGPVGAGKSSLLQAILRELPLCEGNISVNGVISYASQEPWLFSGSIKQNILFDSALNIERYNEVVNVCALKSDFEQFPYGDRTIVGERGITLSGGQKARINLARALYKEADIYLLDDPLSAVDTRVGKHLFEKCIKDFLKAKSCILITHQIQFLVNVDQIVLVENAKILAEGTYQQLQVSGIDFAKTLGLSEITTKTVKNNLNKNVDTEKTSSQESINSSLKSTDVIKPNGLHTEPNQEAETRSYGHVSKSVYVSYFAASGNVFKAIFVIVTFIFTQVLTTGVDYWISYWVNQEEYVIQNENSSVTHNGTTLIDRSFDSIMDSIIIRQNYILVYAVLTLSMIVVILIRCTTSVSFCMDASIALHKRMFDAIIKTKMNFFYKNLSGRILNRFSTDIGTIDEILPFNLAELLQLTAFLLGTLIVVGLVNIYLLIPVCIMIVLFHQFRLFYIATSRSIKRLEGIKRSPVFGHLSASIQGLSTVRAFNAQHIMLKEFEVYQNNHSSVWYLLFASNQGFGFWLDISCAIYTSIVIFGVIFFTSNTYGGTVGLAMTQIIGLNGLIQWGIRQTVELENQMTAVERVYEFTKSPREVDSKTSSNKSLTEWPKSGKIVFSSFSMRYGPDAPLILKDLNFRIEPMEKVGIVGRTGAGKSSLIEALFRLATNEGNIFIDDIEIHDLDLYDLRSSISIIPQEPFLFSGTMRTNLDPFEEYPDHILWDALDQVELKVAIENSTGGLNTKISESGSNFSVGQKQLICLARAIIRNNKILVLDEATANVDPRTDALIQKTIRNTFQTCTVLTIAHRLNTIMDSDRVLVLDAGAVVEFDHPHNLLKNKFGNFYKMVEQTGQTTFDLLLNVAEKNFKIIQKQADPFSKVIDDK